MNELAYILVDLFAMSCTYVDDPTPFLCCVSLELLCLLSQDHSKNTHWYIGAFQVTRFLSRLFTFKISLYLKLAMHIGAN